MVIDTDGNLYTANIYGNNVTKITPDGTSTTFGTTGSYPYSITIDSSGNIYTANYSSQNVTKVTPDGTSRIIGRTNGNPRSIAIDSSGNIYTADYYNTVSKITPTDTNPPVVTLNGQTYDTGYLNRPYVDPGANWTDDPDGNGQATVSGSVDTNNTGTYLLDYSYTDFAGNTGSGTRTVNVIADTEAPVISPYNGTETTVYLNHTYTEYGASCNDNADGYCV